MAEQRPRPRLTRGAALCLSLIALVLEPVLGSGLERTAASSTDREIVVTYDDPSLPNWCRPRPLARVVLDFLDALKEGRSSRLKRFFGPDFKWFSVTGSPVEGHRRHFVAYRERRAIRYITRRGGFNLRLKELVVDNAPSLSQSDISNDGIWRTRRDGAQERWGFVGKGAINCGERTVKVWSMGLEEADARLCPAPSQAVKPGTVIACVQS